MKKLFLIPARGGSKGLRKKNILELCGKPMINYTIDAAKGAMEKGDELCISTDDSEIIQVLRDNKIEVPFTRPPELASDSAGSEEVIIHAVEWYKGRGIVFDVVVLLQPTSPLRNTDHVKEALDLYTEEIDIVASVKETDSNPYYVLFEEDNDGFLRKSKDGNFTRRQECPNVYEFNGAIYVLNYLSVIKTLKGERKKVKKYLMDKVHSIDVDDIIDFKTAEFFLEQRS